MEYSCFFLLGGLDFSLIDFNCILCGICKPSEDRGEHYGQFPAPLTMESTHNSSMQKGVIILLYVLEIRMVAIIFQAAKGV